MSQVIEIKGLKKYYGKNKGVEDVTFSVKEGDIFGFLGPNGAGKSTTIRSMLGFIHYDAGEITILSKNIKTQKEAILKEVGYMPSEAMFYPSMRVEEVIRFAADMRKMDCADEAEKLCERLQLDTKKRIDALSLGNRKKVSIVCAMQHKPKLFVFDEPTSGLDPLMQTEFFHLIQEYVAQGATCMLSTHVLSEVKKYCKNVAIMRNGCLERVDSVENLTRTSAKQVHLEKDGKTESFVYTGKLQELFQRLAQEEITDITIEEPSLDEIFMAYYQKDATGLKF